MFNRRNLKQDIMNGRDAIAFKERCLKEHIKVQIEDYRTDGVAIENRKNGMVYPAQLLEDNMRLNVNGYYATNKVVENCEIIAYIIDVPKNYYDIQNERVKKANEFGKELVEDFERGLPAHYLCSKYKEDIVELQTIGDIYIRATDNRIY